MKISLVSVPIDMTIDVDEFLEYWKEELQEMPFDAFADNMKHLKVKNQDYADWIKTWLAWNELSSDDDIDMMYKQDNSFMVIEG